MKFVALIQARMGSQRLPGKALMKIQGKSALEWIAFRLKACRTLNGVVLATSNQAKDDALESLAQRMSIPCFRGSETDLIQRHLGAARAHQADAILRVTGDCPLVDPKLAERMIEAARKSWKTIDFVANYFPPSFPDGLDLDILPTRTLERLDREVKAVLHREWLTTYILENPRNFRILNVSNPEDLSSLRWTLDYPEDLRFIRSVFRHLSARKPNFKMQDILNLMDKNPKLKTINENRLDKTVVRGIRSHAYHQLIRQETALTGGKK